MIESDDRNPGPSADPASSRKLGRPRKPDALTYAQRSAAYRARKQDSPKSAPATQSIATIADSYDALVVACEALREELACMRAQWDCAQAALARVNAQDDKRTEYKAASRPPQTPPGMSTAILTATQVLGTAAPPDDGNGEKRLAVDMLFREYRSLERLAAHFGLTRGAVLERLIYWADRDIVRTFDDDDAGFDRYLRGVLEGRPGFVNFSPNRR